MAEVPNLRWFDPYPVCGQCGKTAHGLLMSNRNESYGAHCLKCANKRLKDSAKARGEVAHDPQQ